MVSRGTARLGAWTHLVVTMEGVAGGKAAKPTSE